MTVTIVSLSSSLGGPMDHTGPIPMVNDFGGMTPESAFMNQPTGPPGNNGPQGTILGGPGGVNGGTEHMMGRGGSPEFMSPGNFTEPQNMQSEQMVW